MREADASGAKSLWAHTSFRDISFDSVSGDVSADVAIIGGGITGLSAAYHVAKNGRRPIVLEASRLGWGASGRAGGVVSPKFRVPFPVLGDRFGLEVAKRIHEIGEEAVDLVESLVEEFEIKDAHFVRCGHITAAHNESSLSYLKEQTSWINSMLGDASCVILSKEKLRRELGSDSFKGGMLNRRAGSIQPLNFVRGLASSLRQSNVQIHEDSPVLRVSKAGNRLSLLTPRGRVSAAHVLVATNAYSDVTKATLGLHRRMVPFRSAIIATERLPETICNMLLPTRRVCGDTRRLLRWFRIFDDRLVFGGRGAFGRKDKQSAFRALRRSMVEIFPVLNEVAMQFEWSGLVAMTMDYLPHIGRLDSQTFFALGYNGTGIAMSTLMGKLLDDVSRGERRALPLIADGEFRPIPLHSFRAPAVRMVAGWQQCLDWLGR